LTRKWLLRYAELERRGVINEPGDILMDVPASTANGDLVDITAPQSIVRRSACIGEGCANDAWRT